MASIFTKVKVKSIVQETPDAKTFFIEPTDGSRLEYQPGQFLTLIFPKENGNEDRRSYSFSTVPGLDPVPGITIKKVENGEYSRKLLDYVRPGDELLTLGASGFFCLPEELGATRQIVFLAAGSGITPVYSLLKSMVSKKNPPLLTLIYSNHSPSSTIFYKELLLLQQKHAASLKIEFLFSTSANLTRARLGKWLLEKLLAEYVQTLYTDTLFYLCGPFEYMRMATIVLQTEGVPAGNIRKENFASVKPRFVSEPPDKNPHRVTLHLNGVSYSYVSKYPDTILQSAKKEGITLPYSCESGQCGTCVATCLSGKTWMKNNEVLVDSEVEKGRTLTCVGYPVDGDVELKFD